MIIIIVIIVVVVVTILLTNLHRSMVLRHRMRSATDLSAEKSTLHICVVFFLREKQRLCVRARDNDRTNLLAGFHRNVISQ
jgi:hypothetical protein